MDLRQGCITVREILSVKGAEEIIRKHFQNVPMFRIKMNRGKTLNEIVGMVLGKVSSDKILAVRRDLEAL